jgi:hypothetical protein
VKSLLQVEACVGVAAEWEITGARYDGIAHGQDGARALQAEPVVALLTEAPVM